MKQRGPSFESRKESRKGSRMFVNREKRMKENSMVRIHVRGEAKRENQRERERNYREEQGGEGACTCICDGEKE